MGLIKAGVCLHLKTLGEKTPHLFVVLNDPFGDPPQVCIVNFSTHTTIDQTVILRPSDPGMHVFVKQTTYVVYGWALIKKASDLETILKADMSKRHHKTCSEILLRRLREGIFKSPFTKESVVKFCKEAFPASHPKSKQLRQ
jgi:hypothetical protein